MQDKKIAFVSTAFTELPPEYQGSHTPEEPLDIMYAAAAARDAQSRIAVPADPAGAAWIAQSDVIVMSTTNSYLQWNNHPMGLDLFQKVLQPVLQAKAPETPLIVFGPHVPAHHAEIRELGASHIVLGEAELAVAQLASDLAHERNPTLPLGLVPVAAMELPSAAVVAALDELPRPAYEHTTGLPYNAHNHPEDGHLGHLYECSRGCPYFCSFCNTVTHRRQHRVKSPNKIGTDLEQLAGLSDRDYVYFIDESFGFRGKWLTELLPRLAELPFSYGCQGNLSFASTAKFDAMAAAGFINVEFGYETFNEEVVKRAGKTNSMRNARDLINYAAAGGLAPLLFTQVGLPGETHETLRESINFLRSLHPATRVSVAMPTPYFGTQLWREGVAEGTIPRSVRGAQLYEYTGRVGHGMDFDREAARVFTGTYGANNQLTAEFLDELESAVAEVFQL